MDMASVGKYGGKSWKNPPWKTERKDLGLCIRLTWPYDEKSTDLNWVMLDFSGGVSMALGDSMLLRQTHPIMALHGMGLAALVELFRWRIPKKISSG